MMQTRVKEPAFGPWCSPVVLVWKKDGSLRFCNELCDARRRPTHPALDDALEALAVAKLFSTFELTSGYWQVEVAEREREKTAFFTYMGLFQF
ncbi:Transposon Ty3-I Gag-Pol polyprotein [Trichinella pseudospiralis]|uniref:Transposon Ty3-I Gag-Pol polyprotein n=1 Tax=Trichinella pseudospiralis TaxID=6337 RepID=A0A0V1JVC0_TRIPS|nr:Transposon Ty3-I Gag-Pol polyprotein [Trichinella pseudospiralis]